MEIVVLIIGLLVYFIPSFVATNRGTKNKTGIILLNVFLGWTGLGWLGSLIWACCDPLENKKTNISKQTWTYTCEKCGFRQTHNQKLKVFHCPQCHTEEIIKDSEIDISIKSQKIIEHDISNFTLTVNENQILNSKISELKDNEIIVIHPLSRIIKRIHKNDKLRDWVILKEFEKPPTIFPEEQFKK
jgi:predicted RNA-binding Zn-ribbon protein involved in translation (DUF1610 family)